MPFLHSPSRIINPLAHERRFGFGSGMGGGAGGAFVGALDLLTSPTVAFAISPQKLRAAYSGNAFRLRSDGAGSPEENFGFTSAGDLDIAAVTAWLTSTSGSNAYGRTFYDQSTNARDAGQGLSANQPLFAAGALSKGQFTFDGTNDCFDTASWSLAQNFTIWTVLDTAVLTGLNYSSGTLGSTPTFGGTYKNSAIPGAYFGASANHPTESYTANTLSWSCYHVNGASSSLIFNGTASGTLNFGTTGINGGWRVGGRFDTVRWNGKIVEQIIFAGDATTLPGWSAFLANRQAYFSLP